MIIFGLGLPRTGTNSLGLGLHLLNINGECKCILNDYKNKRNRHLNNNNYKYIIYNDAFKDLNTLLDDDKIYDNKYILTIRNNLDWLNSIAKFNNNSNYQDIININQDNYINKIINIFKNKNIQENLLIINLFEEDDIKLWQKLIKFLDLDQEKFKDIIEDEFPKINLNK